MKSIINEIYDYYYYKRWYIENFRLKNNLQPYRISQIIHEVFKNSNINFFDFTTLSKELRIKLSNEFYILAFNDFKIEEGEQVVKIWLKTFDWYWIESVLMFYDNRITLCISSQIWCPVWCTFCVTWKLWFKRNLNLDEIVWQVIFANNYLKKFWKKTDWSYYKVRNIVFMWMGEPLLNYENVKKACEMFLNQKFFSLSKRHVTISTSWIINWIKKIINDNLDIQLAVSLHAPTDLRKKIMPFFRDQNLKELIKILDEFNKKTWKRIFYEYTMIKWLNDDIKYAYELVNLIRHQNAHVNLIPYNENEFIDYIPSDWDRILNFSEILKQNWITVTIRNTLWKEIKWACWQLWYSIIKTL